MVSILSEALNTLMRIGRKPKVFVTGVICAFVAFMLFVYCYKEWKAALDENAARETAVQEVAPEDYEHMQQTKDDLK